MTQSNDDREVAREGEEFSAESLEGLRRALRASELRYRDLADSSTELILCCDELGGVVYANATWRQTLGYDAGDLGSLRFDDVVHPDDLDHCRSVLARVVRGESVADVQARLVTRSGDEVLVRGQVSPSGRSPAGSALRGIFRDVTAQLRAETDYKATNALLTAMSHAQSAFIAEATTQEVFDGLLSSLLEVTESEYGFIGEVHRKGWRPYLKTHAITNIAWNEETRKFYAERAPKGLEFENLETLFGRVITSGQTLISNHPQTDSRAGGIPDGHPPLRSFLGVPIYKGVRLIGMVGIANRESGYDDRVVSYLDPFITTCANIIHACRVERQRETSERALGRSEARLSAIVNHAADGIVTIDSKGRIQAFNPAAERIFGYESAEVLGQNVSVLMTEAEATRHDGYLRDYHGAKRSRIIGRGRELLGRRRDGSCFPLELSVSEMLVEGDRHFIGVARDITERKRITRMKDEFISTVSHELRTPLTSIRGSLGLIGGGAMGEINERVRSLVDIACNNSDRLARLINDILDIQKIESGSIRYQMKRLEVRPLLLAAIAANEGYARAHDVTVSCETEGDPVVEADSDRLTQVLENLLSNAAKFSPRGDTVRVHAKALATRVDISVSDRGPGIPREFHDRIFQKFAQVDSSDSRVKGGTGLGLSICKAIVEDHGGRIWFSCGPEGGSSFFVSLPRAREVDVPATSSTRPSKSLESRPRVLYVEDEADLVTVISASMRPSIDLVHAENLSIARMELERGSFDAVVLDLHLPDGSGATLLEPLSKLDPAPPVIVFTEDESAANELGQVALTLVKSKVSEAELVQSVHDLAGTKRDREQAG